MCLHESLSTIITPFIFQKCLQALQDHRFMLRGKAWFILTLVKDYFYLVSLYYTRLLKEEQGGTELCQAQVSFWLKL